MFNSGGNKTQATANDWIQSATDAAIGAKDKTIEGAQFAMAKTGELAQSATDAAIGAKDKTVKVAQPKTPLEKAGDQVTNAAQGAVDTVKNTLGIK